MPTYNFQIGTLQIDYNNSVSAVVGDTKLAVSLTSLRYHKKMFQPGLVWAKLNLTLPTTTNSQGLTQNASMPSPATIMEYFMNKPVDLSEQQGNDLEQFIAKGYYVYRVSPEFQRTSLGVNVFVILECYSPDHKLTLDKFCRSYTNRKLADDILKGGLSDKDGILAKAGFTAENVDTDHLKFLNYVYCKTDGELTLREFVQPYLVQYNESFYDFMARTANRCGEFFYYENGKLYLGVNDFTNDTDENNQRVDIDRDTVLTYSYHQANEKLAGSVDYYYNSLENNESASDKFSYNSEVPLDEYLGNIVEKDTYTSILNEFLPKMWRSIPGVLTALSLQGVAGVAAWLAGTAISGALFAKSLASTKNSMFNAKWVDKNDPTNNKVNYEERNDGEKYATLYGTLMKKDVQQNNYVYNQNLNTALYRFIGSGSKQVSENLIDVNIGAEKAPYMLGQKVAFDSSSAEDVKSLSRYIIIEVAETIKCEDGMPAIGEWQTGQRVVLAPQYAVSTQKYNDSADVDITIACPPVMCPLVRTTGVQRAFVTEGVDPLGYGRVRIKYPWHSTNDDDSPFVRMAVPYAPDNGENGGGFYFQLRKDCEVLVDYESGNVERPFVIGSLFNAQAKSPRQRSIYAEWAPSLHPKEPCEPLTIASRKGHKILLDDNGNAEDFLMSVLPPVKLSSMIWKKFWPAEWRLDQEMESPFSGGIKLTDKWGMYEISCSTTERAVNIKSPFGNVDINAFTGINISAPNGDINITGKNIHLKAGNELTLQSGANINPPGFSIGRDLILKGIFNGVIDKFVIPLADLRLVRTVAEIFLKPVAGTMSLKSNRYLLLGAGLGMPEIPSRGRTVKGIQKNAGGTERMRVHRQLVNQSVAMNKFFDEFGASYDSVVDALSSLKTLTDEHAENFQLKDFTLGAYTHGEDYTKEELKLKPAADDAVIGRAQECAKTVRNAVLACYQECQKYFGTGEALNFGLDSKLKPGDFQDILKKNMSGGIPVIVQNILDKTCEFKADDPNLNKVEDSRRATKRYFAYHIINNTFGVEYVKPISEKEPNFTNLNDFNDDIRWGQWVGNLHKWTGKRTQGASGAILRFLNEVKDETATKIAANGPWATIQERNTWGPGKKGEILMSDKEGQTTINIVNGALTRTENSEGFTKQVKDLLWNL